MTCHVVFFGRPPAGFDHAARPPAGHRLAGSDQCLPSGGIAFPASPLVVGLVMLVLDHLEQIVYAWASFGSLAKPPSYRLPGGKEGKLRRRFSLDVLGVNSRPRSPRQPAGHGLEVRGGRGPA
jgi:hypothetical protein